ncbi:MAG: substrate-binding domain-containing protein [Actinomycetota bacterium]|nr:substrate-binding domain-containing protein [Actinomycetota bacterium]
MSRNSLKIRGIVLTAVIGATVVALSACTPPMPPDVLAARAEAQIQCSKGNVDISRPQEFSGAMSTVGDALASVCPDQTVTEVDPGGEAPVELLGQAPTPQEILAFKTASCPADKIITIPAFAYPVTIAYSVVGLEGLVFTPQAAAGVLNGTVTTWEDPLIADANPDFDLSGLPPISLVSVEVPSGAVSAMTTWISQQDSAAWPDGPLATLKAGKKFADQEAMLAEMLASEGSLAVLPIFTAVNNGIASANLPVKGADLNGQEVDTVVTADDVQLYKVGSGATNVTTTPEGDILASSATGGFPVAGNFDLASSKIVLGEGAGLAGWPVEGYAHLLICDSGSSSALPLLYAQYLVRLAGQGALESFGLTPMPEPIRIKTFMPLRVVAAPEE